MTVATLELTTADEELNKVVTALEKEIERHGGEKDLEPVELALVGLKAARTGGELLEFQRALVELSRHVIGVRHKGNGRLKQLPIPPYDLWLPFKDGCGVGIKLGKDKDKK